jgi:hypothetical protein
MKFSPVLGYASIFVVALTFSFTSISLGTLPSGLHPVISDYIFFWIYQVVMFSYQDVNN